ncbi:hypothetical protein ACFQ2Z_18590 [Paenibacillus timonensis]|uniref:Amidohydrolase 3 domain-containing protein n=1 Tax=Paenibacillus timonensis TaxID=225915 RepID=A0ABW3SEX6_9BACL|nr:MULTISPECIES: hypothetical protein [Paenibacillus]MDU2240569.1 hypothetical protein [Paenibacillus sp.]
MIAVGQAGDFTVIDREIEGDPQHLLEAQVRMTVVNGEIGYQA